MEATITPAAQRTAPRRSSRVTVIHGTQPTRRASTQHTQQMSRPARKRVAAYCRVSTDHEDQETSFEAQQTHFTNLISGNPDWE